MELKTLSRHDQDFVSYLDGSFSDELRALPLRSLNVGSVSERVTFEIVPLTQIARPSTFRIFRFLARPSTLAFSAAPMLSILAFTCATRALTAIGLVTAISSFFGIIFFHIATNLFNDYGDHIKGQDRVRPHGGSRVIQKGWVRAIAVKRIAWGLVVAAAVCGLPALMSSPLVIVAGLAFLVTLEFAFQRLRLKRRGLAECLAFLLTGPLLTCGYAWAVLGGLVFSDLAVAFACGCVFGSIALMYFHAVNFENIMPDSQAGARTWATRTGFDASKKFFYFLAATLAVCQVGLLIASSYNFRLLPAVVISEGFAIVFCMRVARVASPVSSELRGLRWSPIALSWLTMISLLSCFFWMAL